MAGPAWGQKETHTVHSGAHYTEDLGAPPLESLRRVPGHSPVWLSALPPALDRGLTVPTCDFCPQSLVNVSEQWRREGSAEDLSGLGAGLGVWYS